MQQQSHQIAYSYIESLAAVQIIETQNKHLQQLVNQIEVGIYQLKLKQQSLNLVNQQLHKDLSNFQISEGLQNISMLGADYCPVQIPQNSKKYPTIRLPDLQWGYNYLLEIDENHLSEVLNFQSKCVEQLLAIQISRDKYSDKLRRMDQRLQKIYLQLKGNRRHS